MVSYVILEGPGKKFTVKKYDPVIQLTPLFEIQSETGMRHYILQDVGYSREKNDTQYCLAQYSHTTVKE